MKKFVLHEGKKKRGFISNYITILLALKELIEEQNVNPTDIFISPTMFGLYGNPDNWFDSKQIQHPSDVEFELVDTAKVWEHRNRQFDFRVHPFSGLLPYKKLFDYNDDVKNRLRNDVKLLTKCLGVHYRGTDNNYGRPPKNHAKSAPLLFFMKFISRELESGKYENIFLATDEAIAVEEIKSYCWSKHKFDKIHYNDVTRSNDELPVHKINCSTKAKIRLGYEILLDVHCMSMCQSIICKASNIISYLEILNETTNFIRVDLQGELCLK